MSRHVVVTFKKENRRTVVQYLEEHFKTNELIFAHRFETNKLQEIIVFEANPEIPFPDKIKEFSAQKLCDYVVVYPHDKSVISPALSKMSRIIKPIADNLFPILRSAMEEFSKSFHP